MQKTNRLLCLFLVLTALATGFIFYQSSKDGEESHASSDKIVEVVEPIIGEVPGEKDLSFWVRKAAHVFEFAVLGLCAMTLALTAGRRFGIPFHGWALFYVLLTAVTDEFIQSFTGRTSSVKDIFIDLCGALLGMGIALAIAAGRKKKPGSSFGGAGICQAND